MKTPKRRKVLLIDPGFQTSFLIYTCGIAIVVASIFFGANHYFFWKFSQTGQQIGLPEGHVFFRFLADQRQTMNWIFLATSTLVTSLLIAYGLYLSNRIAGPIYHLKKHLRERKAGVHQNPLKFREKDYFKDLENAVNECLPSERDQAVSQERLKAG